MKKTIAMFLICIVFALSSVTASAESGVIDDEEQQTEITMDYNTSGEVNEESQPKTTDNEDFVDENEVTENSEVTLKSNGYDNDYDYNHEELELEKYKTTIDFWDIPFECIEVRTGHVSSVVSSNPSIADWNDTVGWNYSYYEDREYYDSVCIDAKRPGKTTLTVRDWGGNTKTIEVTVKATFKMYETKGTVSDDMGLYFVATGEINKVYSSNPKILTVKKDPEFAFAFNINPVNVGTAIVTCQDKFGQKATCTITILRKYFSYILKSESDANFGFYGEGIITGKTVSGAIVTATVSGKKCSAKANAKGKFSMSIPIVKMGTRINCTATYKGCSYSFYTYVDDSLTRIWTGKITRKSKKITVYANKVYKGDIITLKIGKKKYRYKIKNNQKSFSHKFKIKKSKAGKKVKVTIDNKYNQYCDEYEDIVYYAKKMKKGMTKKQCKLTAEWREDWTSPDEVYKSGKKTIWWYDDGSYIYFKNGRLKAWYY